LEFRLPHEVFLKFDIDANGILNVSAKDQGTGKEQRITITASTKLSDDDKDRMVREAEEFAEQDRQKKEEVEARNAADTMIYTAEKTMKDLGARIEETQRKRVEDAIAEVRDALFGSDIEKIKAETEKLGEVLQEVSAVIYQQAAQEQAQAGDQAGGTAPGYGSPPPGSAPHEASTPKSDKDKSDAVDADYRVVDDE
jgi:molecular chaperone DnaK